MPPRRERDPDRRRAAKCLVIPIKEDGEVEGKAHVWHVRDEESLILSAWHDGEITAYIEKV